MKANVPRKYYEFAEGIAYMIGEDFVISNVGGGKYEITLLAAAYQIGQAYLSFESELNYMASNEQVTIVAHDFEGDDYYVVVR